ncbi:hypothetical protein [Methylomonas koyamae]|uniref:hypothetical protein n=1 Tax=Methylomonas koyamae TaxID=702114 RepID=UPI002873CF5E|nr:hypothetical protein [Methylomonas koyamae]WNB77571.1 hypothetical protein RI210_08305 [Methylomonas koyamae]
MEQDNTKSNIPGPSPFVPLLTMRRYGDLTGQTYEAIKAQAINGDLPTVKVGKRRMVNILKLCEIAAA